MKKIIYVLSLFAVFSLSIHPAFANETKAKKTADLTVEQQIKLNRIVNRVEEIRDMDKSNLTKVERKALKSELKELKSQARAISNGVYLSFGAIIIIILLLILIL